MSKNAPLSPSLLRTCTPWPYYACDWSQNAAGFCTMAMGSFLPTQANFISVTSLASSNANKWHTMDTSNALPVDYVPTKVMWSPTLIKDAEYLAACGDGVYIWKVSGHDVVESSEESVNGDDLAKMTTPFSASSMRSYALTGRLASRSTPRRSSGDFNGVLPASLTGRPGEPDHNPPAPITAFDWSAVDPTLLVTASYDTTCTVWCLETGIIKTQLIAHDKEVFDVAFSPTSADSFVSVGADGSLRLFDIRYVLQK